MVILHRCRVCFKHKKDENEDKEDPFLSILENYTIRTKFQRKFGISYNHFLLEKHLVLICPECYYKLSNETTKEEYEQICDSVKFHNREHFAKATQQHFGWPSTASEEEGEQEKARKSRKKKRVARTNSQASVEIIDDGQPGMALRSRRRPQNLNSEDSVTSKLKKQRSSNRAKKKKLAPIRRRVTKEVYECNVCQKRFGKRDNLRAHAVIHGPKRHICEFCDFPFHRRSDLNKHVKRIHMNSSKTNLSLIVKDNQPGMTLRSRSQSQNQNSIAPKLNDHRSLDWAKKKRPNTKTTLILNEELHECNVCQKKFGKIKYVRSHAVVHGPKRYICEFCDFPFHRCGDLNRHVSLKHNNGSKTIQNSLKIIPQKSQASVEDDQPGMALRSRSQSQNRERPPNTKSTPIKNKKIHECNVCQKKFGKRKNLTVHAVIHGPKRHVCEFCKRPFHRRNYLNNHVKRMHMTASKTIQNFLKVIPQKSQASVEKIEKSLPGMALRSRSQSQSHNSEVEGVHECNLCHKKYSTKGNLKEHMYKHGPKRLFCDLCDYKCYFKSELQSHNKYKHMNVSKVVQHR